jgi:hypothetical protein
MRSGLIVWVLLAASACEVFGSGDYFDVELVTDKSAYIADSTEVIRLSLTNRSERPVHYICGIGFSLEELDGSTVTKSWAVRFSCQSLHPGIISAGEELTFEISFSSINSRIARDERMDQGEAWFDSSVDYRLKAEGLYTAKYGSEDQLLPTAQRVSNRFKIERPPGS